MSGRDDTRLALKIDVDTHAGLARGVPAIVARLDARGIRASFFVVCGPDRMGRRLGRLLQPGFVLKLRRTRAVRVYGWRTLLSGTLLPARPVAGAFPALLRRLAAAGHEVGVHGHDHARWQDHLPSLSAADVALEVARAWSVYRDVMQADPTGFAAPGWRCTARSLAAIEHAGFAYRSDTRGVGPYRPVADGETFRVPEIPTTLPTLDEIYGVVDRRPGALADHLLARLRAGTLNVHTVHAELEGGPHLDVLEALLAGAARTVRFVRLCDEAAALAPEELPRCTVAEGTVPGRAMPVALQGARAAA